MLYEDQESMSLVIKNIVSEDAGDYRIEAKNELGVDTEVIHLTVKCKFLLISVCMTFLLFCR